MSGIEREGPQAPTLGGSLPARVPDTGEPSKRLALASWKHMNLSGLPGGGMGVLAQTARRGYRRWNPVASVIQGETIAAR